MNRSRSGTSLIDLMISIGIITVLFGGIYLVYFSILTAITNIKVRGAAAAAVSQELETIRNLPYASVGTVGGIPAGVIPQVQAITVGSYTFTLATTVRNIDDPFDGTLGGSPNDTAPADYKLLSINATCPLCAAALSVELTTIVAPKDLESATQDGSLFLYAVDANGNPVSEATVHVTNASVTPSIDLTDTTNASGVLELVGVPTSTQNYAVTMTKAGYSTDRTYPPGGAGNPNPMKPSLTAAAQTVTAATFAIDRVSQLSVVVSDNQCVPVANEPFSMTGTKLIGTGPNVIKFSTSSTVGATGIAQLSNVEWDTYILALNDNTKNLAGTIPLSPLAVNPSSTVPFRFVVQPEANPSLLITAVDSASGGGITNAAVTVFRAGFSKTLTTGQATLSQSDWSSSGNNGYASQSGGIDVTSVPGAVTLLANASGTYATGAPAWLISNTFDLGGTHSSFYNLTWNPTNQPAATGVNSLEFQVAGNTNNATWNFVGPDGTAATYFTAPGPLPVTLDGDRYFRYEAFLATQDSSVTPELDDISFGFSADCVPTAQALFTGLSNGNYTVDVAAANYEENSTTVSVGAGFQSSTLSLIHL